MSYRNFGLNGPPFQFTPSPPELYMSAEHREGLAALEWGVLHEPSGFTLLVGETGTGKTTLIRAILARDYKSVRIACVTNPKLRFEDMLREIARQLQIEPWPNEAEMLNGFDRFLAQLERGERVVIIVDEAQGLNDERLEELRLFSNRDGHEKQLHFVLVGQPELLHRLMQPKLRQFNDRIGARAVVKSLTIDQAVGYVEWRMKAQGGNSTKVFARGALRYLIDHSDGIPRRINMFCHNAMLLAYSAGQRGVDLRSARAAVAEYENLFASRGGRTKGRPMRRLHRLLRAGTPAAGVFALGLLSFGSFIWASQRSRYRTPMPAVAAAMASAAHGAPELTATGTISSPLGLRGPIPVANKATAASGTSVAPKPTVRRRRWRHSRHHHPRVHTRKGGVLHIRSW